MKNTTDFTTGITVDQTPEEVFSAVRNVRGWWSEEIVGDTANLDDEFLLKYADVHRCRIKLTEVVPNEKIVWKVLENYFSFTKDTSEWTGDEIIFEITETDGKTKLRFTQKGLRPENECYDVCSNAWGNYVQNSLRSLITTGKGQPNSVSNPQTEDEKRFSEKATS